MDPVTATNQLDLPEIDAFPFDGDVYEISNGVLDAYGVSGNTDTIRYNASNRFPFPRAYFLNNF